MKKQTFTCTLKTDIVLTGNSATEGFQPALSYIPGAKFWGIAANSIFNDENATPELKRQLLSNTIRFGDARPLIDGEPSLKVPLLWMTAKGNERNPGQATIYLSHKLSDEDREKITADDVQLKQMREGFFSPVSKMFWKPSHSFYLKSAYDSRKRRADEGKMFGYHVLSSGSQWQFEVIADKDKHLLATSNALKGLQRIGRSRSAEFGLVDIQLEGKIEEMDTEKYSVNPEIKKVLLYAQSNLCFINKVGQNVLVPDDDMLVDFGFPEGSRICHKSKIRHRLYQSWNTKRFNRDHDRQIVEAGSVFIIELPDGIEAFDITPFIGSYHNEGFGAILVNPEFLASSGITLDFKLKEGNKNINNTIQETLTHLNYIEIGTGDSSLLQNVLKQRQSRYNQYQEVDKVVNDFIHRQGDKFLKVSPSQWGVLRNLAKGSNSDEILKKILLGFEKDDKEGFLYKGHSAGQWAKGREPLKDFLFGDEKPNILKSGISVRELLTKLASQMSKHNNKKQEENKKEVANA